MKLLLDAQLPPTLCRWFEEQGHEAVHAQDLPDPPVTDEFIAILAEHEEFVVVSKDEDFLRLHQQSRFQLLWLRCGNITNRALRAWLSGRFGYLELSCNRHPAVHVVASSGSSHRHFPDVCKQRCRKRRVRSHPPPRRHDHSGVLP